MKVRRLLATGMATLMSLSLFSCVKTAEKADMSVQSVETETLFTAEKPSEKAYDGSTSAYVSEAYGDIDLGGRTFCILSFSPGRHYYYQLSDNANEIWYEEDSAEVQQHSVFTRNLLTEDLINIKIEPTWGGDAYDMYDRARTIAQAGVDDFDAMQTAHFRGFLSGMLGYFYNLYDVDTFDMDAYWWNREYIDVFTYGYDTLCTVTGDCLIFDDLALRVQYYNKSIVENYGLADPADLVESGEWTLDTMMEMADKVTSDTNGNGELDAGDTWGILDNNGVAIINFFDGCAIRLAEKDGDDMPYLAVEQGEFINCVQYIYDHIVMSDDVLVQTDGENLDVFVDDRGLFMPDQLSLLFALRNMESDFSFVPLPKFNREQKDYASVTSGALTTVLAIPMTVKDPDTVGVILNVFGGFSTDTVDRALNEVILGAKLIRDERTVEMLGYALESKFYDWAKDIKWAFPIYQAMKDQSLIKAFHLASSIKREARTCEAMLKMMLNGYSFY